MKNRTKLAFLAGLVAAWAGLAWAAAAPQVIPFQGRLTDQNGTAYGEGTYTILFNLYDAPVGGTSLWTERHTGVGLVNGMVNVFLGSIVPLDEQDFTQTRYLGITIDADGNANTADPEMVPRQMIVPAFFAKDSESLRGADWSAILARGSEDPVAGYIDGAKIDDKSIKDAKLADGSVTTSKIKNKAVTSAKIANGAINPDHLSAAMKNDLASAFLPPGIIMPFAGPVANVPDGWLPCDGKTVKSTDYPKLFANIGTTWGYETNIIEEGVTYFKLPDLQNRTLWGADTHKVGEYVEAGLPNITGTFNAVWEDQRGRITTGAFSSTANGGANECANSPGSGQTTWNFDASRCSTIYGNSDTVQSPAGAVNFIIKVDPRY